MAQRKLLRDRPSHRDADYMRCGKAHMLHKRSGVIREHRDAVVHVRFFAQSRAALIEGQHAIVTRKRRCEIREHTLIALRPVNHDKRVTGSSQLIGKLDSVYACSFHIFPLSTWRLRWDGLLIHQLETACDVLIVPPQFGY